MKKVDSKLAHANFIIINFHFFFNNIYINTHTHVYICINIYSRCLSIILVDFCEVKLKKKNKKIYSLFFS